MDLSSDDENFTEDQATKKMYKDIDNMVNEYNGIENEDK